MNLVKGFVPQAAKSAAMFAAPFILIMIGWLVDNVGIDVARPELDQIEVWVSGSLVAVVNAAWTYYQKNAAPKGETNG